MALREILTQGDPVLTKTCRPVEKFILTVSSMICWTI